MKEATVTHKRGWIRLTCRAALCLSVAAGAWLFISWLFEDTFILHGYDAEEVRFKSRDATLAGTLVLPRDTDPAAALILIHGSGKQKRLLPLAAVLADRGFAVFTYDKRGCGRSGGVFDTEKELSAENLNLLADDAAAAAGLVARHARTADLPLGFFGLSQGGWIGPLAAARTPETAFMAYWSGPVCTVSEELHFSDFAEEETDFWANHTQAEVDAHMRSVRYRSDDVDPCDSLAKLSIPGLWLLGGRDQSIPVALTAVRLDELISAGQQQFEYKIYPSLGHADIDEGVVRDLSAWVRAKAGSAGTEGGP